MTHQFFSLGRKGPRGAGGVMNLLGSGQGGETSAEVLGCPEDANALATLAPPCGVLWAYPGGKRL